MRPEPAADGFYKRARMDYFYAVGTRAWCIAAMGLLVAACSGAGREHAVVVFAASSLREAFAEIEGAFEAAEPGSDVQLTFGGSQVLRLQLEQGAPADVFASADPAHAGVLSEAGVLSNALPFAGNELVIITPKDDPSVVSFADLSRASRIVTGTDAVPVGLYTREALAKARTQLGDEFVAAVRASIVSKESNVRLVRAKVELGEADAAFVYRTDAAASHKVRAVALPPEVRVHARYVIGMVAASRRAELAAKFVAFTRSPSGQSILERHGFNGESG